MPPLAAYVGTFTNRASRTAVIATCSSADFGSFGFIRAEVGFTTCVLRCLSIMFQPQEYAVPALGAAAVSHDGLHQRVFKPSSCRLAVENGDIPHHSGGAHAGWRCGLALHKP